MSRAHLTNSNLDIGSRIRDNIVSGILEFGERIMIDALATRYGVSHMPVREALRELRGDGLVVIEPNHGAPVRTRPRPSSNCWRASLLEPRCRHAS